ncbi:MAG: calcium/sodium antiporter [Desulfurivibrionaceae bacterium]
METHFSSIPGSITAFIAGLVILISGGELLISGAVKLARRWGMTSLLVGLTIIAFGTSAPELFVSLSANLQGEPDLMLGNVIGSNIANIGLILAISALIRPIFSHHSYYIWELSWVLGATILLALFAWQGHFNRITGLVFMGGLVFFCWLSWRKGRTQPEQEMDGPGTDPLLSSLLLCGAGLIGLSLGSDLFIKGAVDMALYLEVPALIIGLTMAALGTSLPELASSISAIRRGHVDMILGNIIGSNIFNLLMVLGISGAVKPFTISPDVLGRDIPAMLAFPVFIMAALYFQLKISRWHGVLMLAGYIGYLLLLEGCS